MGLVSFVRWGLFLLSGGACFFCPVGFLLSGGGLFFLSGGTLDASSAPGAYGRENVESKLGPGGPNFDSTFPGPRRTAAAYLGSRSPIHYTQEILN